MESENAIVLENISKEFKVLNKHEGLKGSIRDLFSRDYKTIRAVDNVSMSIKRGEIVGYLGPNGAGKSTTIKIMSGVLMPSEGKITVNGMVPYKDRTKTPRTSALYSARDPSFGGHCLLSSRLSFLRISILLRMKTTKR